MKYCDNCNKKLNDNANFCPDCGAEVKIVRDEDTILVNGKRKIRWHGGINDYIYAGSGIGVPFAILYLLFVNEVDYITQYKILNAFGITHTGLATIFIVLTIVLFVVAERNVYKDHKALKNQEKITVSDKEYVKQTFNTAENMKHSKDEVDNKNEGKISQNCETEIKTSSSSEPENDSIRNTRVKKVKRTIGILNVIAGGILLFLGIGDIEYDWGIISLVCGLGFFVSGILQLAKKGIKPICIIKIVFGSLALLLGIICLDYIWGYIGVLTGTGLLVVGILGLLRRSQKVIAIVEVVFGGLVLSLSSNYFGGVIALFAAIPLLVAGILELVNMKYLRAN